MIVILYCSIFACTYLLKPSKDENDEYNALLGISAIFASLSILGNQYFIFVRPALYFNIFVILIIPELINRFVKKERKILIVIISSLSFLFLFYYLSHNWHDVLPYETFINSYEGELIHAIKHNYPTL